MEDFVFFNLKWHIDLSLTLTIFTERVEKIISRLANLVRNTKQTSWKADNGSACWLNSFGFDFGPNTLQRDDNDANACSAACTSTGLHAASDTFLIKCALVAARMQMDNAWNLSSVLWPQLFEVWIVDGVELKIWLTTLVARLCITNTLRAVSISQTPNHFQIDNSQLTFDLCNCNVTCWNI